MITREKLEELKKKYGNTLFYQCILRDYLKEKFKEERRRLANGY